MFNLRLEEITLGYGKRVVLKDIGLQVEPGEMVGIIGPNGCGKSTLIKGITRLIPWRSGGVFINSCSIAKLSRADLARLVAVVPQTPLLPELFTAFEVVLMGRTPHLGYFRYESDHDLTLVWEAMEATATLALAERRIAELSGGERQRLVIARALAQEPKIILLDEPTAHLDINYQIEILNLIHKLCLERELIVIAALHDLNLAAQYCDRLILLHNGKIYRQGIPDVVINAGIIKEVYGAEVYISTHPVTGLPAIFVIPDGHKSGQEKLKEKSDD